MTQQLEFVNIAAKDSNGTILKVTCEKDVYGTNYSIHRNINVPNVTLFLQMNQRSTEGYRVCYHPMFIEDPAQTTDVHQFVTHPVPEGDCDAEEVKVAMVSDSNAGIALTLPIGVKWYTFEILPNGGDVSKKRKINVAFTNACTHPDSEWEDGEFWGGGSGSCCVKVELVCKTCRATLSSRYEHRD